MIHIHVSTIYVALYEIIGGQQRLRRVSKDAQKSELTLLTCTCTEIENVSVGKNKDNAYTVSGFMRKRHLVVLQFVASSLVCCFTNYM